MNLFLNIWLALFLIHSGSIANKSKDCLNDATEVYSVYILKHRWHTGIIFAFSDVKDHLSFLNEEFKEAEYIEIGWGDQAYYMAEETNLGLAAKAAMWPTKSVLHVAEFEQQELRLLDKGECIPLELNSKNFSTIVSYIHASFYLSDNDKALKLGKGLYNRSWFYASIEKYHIFNTCNVWLARGLKKANVSIKPVFAISSGNVIKQLENNESLPSSK